MDLFFSGFQIQEVVIASNQKNVLNNLVLISKGMNYTLIWLAANPLYIHEDFTT